MPILSAIEDAEKGNHIVVFIDHVREDRVALVMRDLEAGHHVVTRDTAIWKRRKRITGVVHSGRLLRDRSL